MATIYPALQSLVVDCQKLYYESDKNNVSAMGHRTVSVALRALGALTMLSSTAEAYYNQSSLLFILLRGTIGHELFAIGSSLSEKANRLSGDASYLDTLNATKNKGWNIFGALSKGNATMTADIKELLQYTWVLKHIYDSHTDAINIFFSRFLKPE